MIPTDHSDYKYIRSLVQRYLICNKEILSLASGTCDEEFLLSEIGGNTVKCIDIAFLNWGDYPGFDKEKERVTKEVISVRDFKEDKKYDVIYTNSPGDWMNTPVSNCKIIPDEYRRIFDNNAKDNCLLIVQLRGGYYPASKLNDKNFQISLMNQIKTEASKLEFKELWGIEPEGGKILIIVAANYDLPINDTIIDEVENVGHKFTKIF